MGLTEELPVYKASYDLLLMIFHVCKDFQKDYKYTLGEKLKNEVSEMVTQIYRANSSGK
ncbi:MAG: four helix bundle protein [Ignavibacteriales bacterium]|nr:four helix bundle protein [Ignavibacteriales bacterium]